jgi:sodium/potassium-transporting ATPase subunit alpha
MSDTNRDTNRTFSYRDTVGTANDTTHGRPASSRPRCSSRIPSVTPAPDVKKGKKGKANRADKLADLKKELTIDDHLIPLDKLFARYGVKDLETGLTTAIATQRLEEEGLNQLTPPPTKPEWLKFLEQLFGGFATLLWAGAVLCFIAYGVQAEDDDASQDNLYLGVVLSAVVLITGIFSYFQESKAGNIMKSFASLTPDQCNVLRDGKVRPRPCFPARRHRRAPLSHPAVSLG